MTEPRYQVMPTLSPSEYEELRQSIQAHGVLVPVLVDEEGEVLDGHHRQKIADALGVDYPVEVRAGLTEAGKRTLAYSLNLHRRQLDREAKRALIAASLKADPDLSNRQHADRTGADHKTVGSQRERMESTGEIPQSETRTSADGRQRPATVKHTTTTTETSETTIDPETAEILDQSSAQPTPPADADTPDADPPAASGASLSAAPEPPPAPEFATVGDLIDWCPDSGQWLAYQEMQRTESTRQFAGVMNRRLPRDADQDIAELCPPEALRSAIFAAEVAATYWTDLAADLRKRQHPTANRPHLAAVEG